MNFLHGNDKKRIKSALNDKKRNGVKLTIQEVIYGGTNSNSKMVQQMIKSKKYVNSIWRFVKQSYIYSHSFCPIYGLLTLHS